MSESELCYLSAGQALARRAAETLAAKAWRPRRERRLALVKSSD